MNKQKESEDRLLNAKQQAKYFIFLIIVSSSFEVTDRCNIHWKQEAQLMLTNRLDMFSGQSRSTNMVPFHMLHIVSYCAIVTFYDIRLQKISW